ncbi:hypothetical protein [Thiomicrospira sp. WB1]|uniref:hypothetical protein n=1 Tax=Thiomicrospira sp. WB1 TaxID=1685380 RepID=UPI000747981A|nr:hypothetical protein [Thiomicrospira sp. WB1]KUJ72320.1 hypothetical protein AVO41_00440 [Thiomicrospira sp. WB1]
MTHLAQPFPALLRVLVLFTGLLALPGLALGAEPSEPVQWEASISDYGWDGKTVPEGQQCQRFGGIMPATPEIRIRNLPMP